MKDDILDGAADLWEKTIDDIVKDQPVSQDYYEFKYSTGNDIGRTYPQAEYVFFSPAIESSSDLSRFPEPNDIAPFRF